ncbi:hypothetical protein [Actinosynnema sp.]|uniref:hypothetical protein n=1 Tax=Actinosynnema sp. TaxID=1872144 RepID=UPI003F83C245
MRVVDARGAVLLPGLVDAHVHVTTEAQLTALRDHGATTALDVAAFPITAVDALRSLPGQPETRTAGVPAATPGGHRTRVPGFPPDAEVAGPADADAFVAARLAEGADHLKVVLEGDLVPVPAVAALVAAAHARGLLVVAHTADHAAVVAAEAGGDVLTHLPPGAPPGPAPVAAQAGRVVAPTLTMVEEARSGRPRGPWRARARCTARACRCWRAPTRTTGPPSRSAPSTARRCTTSWSRWWRRA